ncbi:alpha/beta fold hydrolase [Pusillimonas minor]|uniref:Alpha/beta hydrolase n=1 Tax=Pusillimonas minor TaxID=2697024 RepID=A0A842HP62_9BURK|nr:alpha/beta hydrolase [Pusillimonas minor]MBC2769398.1 alpha/beta hydrolase [Pusillimonas minor]
MHDSSVTPATAVAEHAFTARRVRTRVGDVAIRECGHGPDTIVLLHGISSGAGSWAQCAGLLADCARVIAWDAPGYGESDPLPQARPVATDYAARLDALLDALGISDCVLVGHSLGALMAAGYSSLPTARAHAYVVFSPALGYGGSPRADQVRQGRLANLDQLGIAGMAKALPSRLLSEAAGDAQRAAVTANALRLNEAGYRQAVELLCGDDINRYDGFTPESCSVYCGDKDIVTTPAQSAAYAQRHGLPFELVAGAGHACYIEQPAQVAALIRLALASNKGQV